MEKRSARARKVRNYAHLDSDSDGEFFDDKPSKSKNQTLMRRNDDCDWQFGSDSDDNGKKKESKTKKQAKKSKTPKTVVVTNLVESSLSSSQNESTVVPISTPSVTPAAAPIPSVTHISHASVTVNSPKLARPNKLKTPQSAPSSPYMIGSPITPSSCSSLKTHFAVTPTSGLRIGLSRKQKLKPLHSNVRIV